MFESIFPKELANALSQGTRAFPIDFDLATECLGFDNIDKAKKHFTDCNFVEGIDYVVVMRPEQGRVEILLGVKCFKGWAMMANTPQGAKVRLHYLTCETVAFNEEVDKAIKLYMATPMSKINQSIYPPEIKVE
jgi:hypothetical protein